MLQTVLAILTVTLARAQSNNGTLRVNFGSCHDVGRIDVRAEEDIRIWRAIKAREPDSFFWLGDNIYADEDKAFVSEEFMEENYAVTKNVSTYKEFVDWIGIENIHGTWDDHDYGADDGGKEFEYKMYSQQRFLDFFDIAPDNPRRFQEGVQHSQLFLDGQVKAIFLDTRYFRDPYSNSSGDFLGEEQWRWLEAELNEETNQTRVNIIITSLQLLPDDKTHLAENWEYLPESRKRFIRTVSNSNAENVVLFSGDVHYTEVLEADCSCDGADSYLIPEMTSSGLTHHGRSDRIFLPRDWVVTKSIHRVRNFGELNVDMEAEELTLSAFDEVGDRLHRKTYPFSSLKGNDIEGTCSCKSNFSRLTLEEMLKIGGTVSGVFLFLVIAIVVVYKRRKRARRQINLSIDEKLDK